MRGNDLLSAVLAILKELDGYFVFTDEGGEEYVVASRRKVKLANNTPAEEKQLRLEPAPESTRDRILEDMNRVIALTRESEMETPYDDIGMMANESDIIPRPASEMPPPRRVRFEPLRGDLPPELQE